MFTDKKYTKFDIRQKRMNKKQNPNKTENINLKLHLTKQKKICTLYV